ncbi:MAG: hypothetical protein ACREVX_08160 [Clostridium sp.]|uniref:hypothetical protein n=1 Tax=Clostridium sp. TaxID=1506 RepID=UPI003D6D4A86
MFFSRKKVKQNKENDARLRRIDNFEVRYITTRDPTQYGESIIGKSCVIKIIDNQVNIQNEDNIIFTHPMENLQCSELMSQNGVILSYVDAKTGEDVEVIAYYKYHRK